MRVVCGVWCVYMARTSSICWAQSSSTVRNAQRRNTSICPWPVCFFTGVVAWRLRVQHSSYSSPVPDSMHHTGWGVPLPGVVVPCVVLVFVCRSRSYRLSLFCVLFVRDPCVVVGARPVVTCPTSSCVWRRRRKSSGGAREELLVCERALFLASFQGARRGVLPGLLPRYRFCLSCTALSCRLLPSDSGRSACCSTPGEHAASVRF